METRVKPFYADSLEELSEAINGTIGEQLHPNSHLVASHVISVVPMIQNDNPHMTKFGVLAIFYYTDTRGTSTS